MAPALGAQSVAENRAYLRLGGAYHMNDMKAFLGNRTFSPVYEFGYDFKGPTETTGFGLYVSYITGHGNPMSRYRDIEWYEDGSPVLDDHDDPTYTNNGMKQTLFGWRLGGDLRYRTPLRGLTLFMGFSANWWDGLRLEPGRVQHAENFNYSYYFTLPKGNWPEGKAKVGWRIGAEYRITDHWGVSWDTSVSSWLSRSGNTSQIGQDTLTGTRAYKGINPVNPSWMNFAVQYRWSIWD